MKLKNTIKYVIPLVVIGILFGVWCLKRYVADSNGGPHTLHIVSHHRLMLGTVVEIVVIGNEGDDEMLLETAVNDAFTRLSEIEKIADRFDDQSEISRVNRQALSDVQDKAIPISGEMMDMLMISQEISELTCGAFDITIAPVMDLWSFNDGLIPDENDIAINLNLVDYRRVILDKEEGEEEGREGGGEGGTILLDGPGVEIDLGGIAKGYGVDEAREVLMSYGIVSGAINAGGDIAIIGDKAGEPWRIGVQDPRDSDNLRAILCLVDTAVATSGDYERYFIKDGKRYHHILDPKTGYPAGDTISVTVLTGDVARADALATAIFVLGAEDGLKLASELPDVEALIIGPDNETLFTPGLSEIIELNR